MRALVTWFKNSLNAKGIITGYRYTRSQAATNYGRVKPIFHEEKKIERTKNAYLSIMPTGFDIKTSSLLDVTFTDFCDLEMQQLKSAISTWSIKSNFVFPVTRLIRNQRAHGAAAGIFDSKSNWCRISIHDAAQIPIDDEKQNSSEKTQKQESKFDKILGDFGESLQDAFGSVLIETVFRVARREQERKDNHLKSLSKISGMKNSIIL